MTTKLLEKIRWLPHKNQIPILKCKNKAITVCAGRRFGKSAVAAYKVLSTIVDKFKKKESVKVWIIAPTYELTMKVFEYLNKWYLTVFPSQSKNTSTRIPAQIKLPYAGFVQCKSGENPSGMLGESLDLLVIDEAARVKREIYESYLYPTLEDRNGSVFMISTPLGKNWFYQEYLRCKREKAAFHYTSLDGVVIDKEKFERAKKRLPSDVFEQEYLAQFREGAASVFRGIELAVNPSLENNQPPQRDHSYIMGLDLAKHRDFTVLTIVDKNTHNVVCWDRFQKIPYTQQKVRILQKAQAYNSKIVIDSLNVGAAIGDDLRSYLGTERVIDFKTKGGVSKDWQRPGSKERLIEKLSSFIEEKNIHLPPNDILLDELANFNYDITDSGRITYSAPSGFHDDCVISLALACWPLKSRHKQENIFARQSMPKVKKSFQYY